MGHIRSLALLPSLLLLTGCDFTSNPKDDYEARLHHLTLQNMCAEAGRQFWKDLQPFKPSPAQDTVTMLDHSNHYNQRLNQCLVEVDIITLVQGSNTMKTIYDAYEAREIAHKSLHNVPDLAKPTEYIEKEGNRIEDNDVNRKWFEALMTE